MKIRFFNTYEPVSAFYRDLVPYLATNNPETEVEIVVSRTEYRERSELEAVFAPFTNVKIIRTINLGLQANQGTLAKAIVTVLYTIQAMLYSLFGPKSDRNVFLSQPPMISLLGWLLFLVRRQPYFCVVMDVHPQVTVALGLTKDGSVAIKFFKYLSLTAWKQASGVIVIGRCMKEKLISFGVPQTQIHFIPNWANEDEIRPASFDENMLVNDKKWDDKFIVMYAGNMGIPQYFDDLLTVAKRLQFEKRILFVFIGGGARKQYIEEYAAQHSLENVEILPFLHSEYSLGQILSAGHIHFVSLKNAISGLAVPSKAYSILCAGRPIIYQGEQYGEIARMISEENIGVVLDIGNCDGLEAHIMQYLNDSQRQIREGAMARKLAEKKYHKGIASSLYNEILLPHVPVTNRTDIEMNEVYE